MAGLFEMGTSFGIDGTVITSDDNWLRLFPDRPRDEIQLGPDPPEGRQRREPVRDGLAEFLPTDVLVLTRKQFVAREKNPTGIGNADWVHVRVWRHHGFRGRGHYRVPDPVCRRVGAPQRIRDPAGHRLPQSFRFRHRAATGGYPGVLGYLPGLAIVYWLYGKAAAATNLPLYIIPGERSRLPDDPGHVLDFRHVGRA